MLIKMFSENRKRILIETIVQKYTTFNIFDIRKFKIFRILNKGEVCVFNVANCFLFDNRYLKFMVAGKAPD